MRNSIFVLLLLFFGNIFCQTAVINIRKIEHTVIQADTFLGFDPMGSLYYIKNNVLSKKNKEQFWEYKNLSLGKLTRIDIQNPLKLVLFYENFNTVIILDNQLNEIQKINFSENTQPILATAIGIASQNKLWLYNSLSQQIGLFDYTRNTFQPITSSFKGRLKYYESDFNSFQWIDQDLNWFSCDIFGKITSFGEVSNFDQIQLIGNNSVLFSKDGKLYLQDRIKNTVFTIEIVENSFENFYYKDQILSIFTKTGITNYKITIP